MAELLKKIQIGWQVFRRREATSEYITRSGMCIDLVRFDALCATCGQTFMAKATKSNWRRKELSRRCERHRAPSIWVNNDKPPVPVAEMPWWAKPAPWRKIRPRKAPREAHSAAEAPAAATAARKGANPTAAPLLPRLRVDGSPVLKVCC